MFHLPQRAPVNLAQTYTHAPIAGCRGAFSDATNDQASVIATEPKRCHWSIMDSPGAAASRSLNWQVIMSMKRILGLILLLGLFGAAQSMASAQNKKPDPKQKTKTPLNNDEVIAQIKKYREEGDQKLADNKFTRKEVTLGRVKEAIRQKWEKVDAYYEGARLVRLQLYYLRKGIGERRDVFYLRDNKLVFAFIQEKDPRQEGKDMGETGQELYFYENKLIKFEDRSSEQSANAEQEKKVYESRLPLEVSKLLEILKKN